MADEDLDLPPASDDSIVQQMCMCGCGHPTPVATRTRPYLGLVKGQPINYIRGHSGPSWLERAMKKIAVSSDGCWIWPSSSIRGYGVFGNRGAHVVVYELIVGPVPAGQELDHTCRRKSCVNPDHLEPVSHVENVRRGAAAKLSLEQVVEARSSSESGASIARKMGVSRSCISSLRSGATWKT